VIRGVFQKVFYREKMLPNRFVANQNNFQRRTLPNLLVAKYFGSANYKEGLQGERKYFDNYVVLTISNRQCQFHPIVT